MDKFSEIRDIGKETSRAIARLRHDPDFKVFLTYLDDLLRRTREKGDFLIEPHKGWNQGWCQALSFLRELPEQVVDRRRVPRR